MPETRNLRRWLIVGVLILLTGCSGQAGTPSTTTFNSTTTVADSTTITAGSTSTTLATTTTTTIPVELVDCDGRDGGLLCEGYVLIHRYYVDPVDDSTLAAAATEGVEALETSGADSVSCAIPNPSFRVVCDAMAVEGASTERASEAALIGMVAALDPNSGYLDSEALRLIQEDQTGQVEGIGALVASEDLTAADPQSTPCGVISATCRLIVVSTFSNGPADRAGLEAGDVLVAVNAESIDGWNIDQVTATVRGRAGTDVTLTVVREGRELDITITREAVVIPVVET
ncbi:MAG: S41 family peptidase, partial [Acidimicrobiia bacterium]